MRALDPRDVLELIDRGATAGPAQRALLVLDVAYPDVDGDTIGAAALSHRDRALLAVHARFFGPRIDAHERCDHCGMAIELSITAADVDLAPVDPPFPLAPTTTLAGGIGVRAVTAGDVALVEQVGDVHEARALLVDRVALGAVSYAGDDEVPDFERALDEALERLDPAADVELALRCPECGDTTVRAFDAARFVWQELVAAAPRIMADVADLAREFHWSEHDILAMPAARRAYYLAEARA